MTYDHSMAKEDRRNAGRDYDASLAKEDRRNYSSSASACSSCEEVPGLCGKVTAGHKPWACCQGCDMGDTH